MFKKKETMKGVSLNISQTRALNRILTLINSAEEGYKSLAYTLELRGSPFREELVVHIQNYVTDIDYISIQHLSGRMFHVVCKGVAMCLTEDEVLMYFKNLELVK